MKKIIVDSWTKVPFIGLQISNCNNSNDAFKYAEKEYLPFGYNLGYWAEDLKTLFIKQN
jgi:hypothetical protein